MHAPTHSTRWSSVALLVLAAGCYHAPWARENIRPRQLGRAQVSHAGVTRADTQTHARHAWGGLGLGYGSASFSCNSCDYRRATGTNSTRLDGWSFTLGLGWKSNRHVRLGIEYRGWLNGLKAGDSLPGLDIGTVFLSYSPRIRTGLFVEGGPAITHYTLTLGTGDPIEPDSRTPAFAAGYGWGYALGIGWQGPSGFTPRVTLFRGKERTLHAAGGATVATGWRENVLFAEIGYRTP